MLAFIFEWYLVIILSSFFFFNDTATTEIYTLSLHDALPIFRIKRADEFPAATDQHYVDRMIEMISADRKSTRLNSSHQIISYAVFCLKKKNIDPTQPANGVITSPYFSTSYDSTYPPRPLPRE